MQAVRLLFVAPRTGRVRAPWSCPTPAPDTLLVRTLYSGISTGTELLAYQGLLDPDLPIDERIGSLGGTFSYPFPYGYSCVGEVERSTGSGPGGDDGLRVPSAPGPVRDRDRRRRRAAPGTDPRAATLLPYVETGLQLSLDAGRWRRRPSPCWVWVRSA